MKPEVEFDDRQAPIHGIPIRSIRFAGPNANALGARLMHELTAAITSAPGIVLVRSTGSRFSSGLDTREIGERNSAEDHLQALEALYRALIEHPHHTACLVHAAAIAGGVGLALCPDVTIMNCEASLSLPGKAEYQPLAEVLYPIVKGCRPSLTRGTFDRWYRFPATALEAKSGGIVHQIVHDHRADGGGEGLVAAARGAIEGLLDRNAERIKPSDSQWADFAQRKKRANEISRRSIFQHSLWLERQRFSRSRDSRTVFVVHGRNRRVADAMFAVLRALGLQPLEWEQIRGETPQKSPYCVVSTGLAKAQAMVVLLTGDDLARLKSRFWRKPSEEFYETQATPQPRQNVLIEAGMGLGMCEQRTVLIELERCRPASDIEELPCVSLVRDEAWGDRLRSALAGAGCRIKITSRVALHAAISELEALVDNRRGTG